MTKVESLAQEVYDRYGAYSAERFAGCWRVWIRGMHQHYSSASCGGFSAQGKTLRETFERLLDSTKKSPPRAGASCERGCPEYCDDDF